MSQSTNSWGIEFMTMFDMSADADLFLTRDAAERMGGSVGPDGRITLPPHDYELWCETAPGQYARVSDVLKLRGIVSIQGVPSADDPDDLAIGATDVSGEPVTDPKRVAMIETALRDLDRRLLRERTLREQGFETPATGGQLALFDDERLTA